MREHFTRAGKPKLPLTRERAEARASQFTLLAYECSTCGAWHLATPKPERRR